MVFRMPQGRNFSFHGVIAFYFLPISSFWTQVLFSKLSLAQLLPVPCPLNPVGHPFLVLLLPSFSILILTPPELGHILFILSQPLCFSFLPTIFISPFLAPSSFTPCPFLLLLLLFVPYFPVFISPLSMFPSITLLCLFRSCP